ncbi:hypothetical protein, partial [Kineococcus siccus]|uniref:hypothetical protein n=1 Tax=Kineococcus siccus TaxID=2696567 RepID=UPI00196B9572
MSTTTAPVRVWRGLLVWLHVVAAVTWLSQALTLLVLLSLSAAAPAGEFKVATAEVAELLDLKLLGTSAIAAASTGLGLAAVTAWGFSHHRWVATKVVLTLLQVLTGTLVVAGALPEVVAAARAGTDGPAVSSAVAVGLVAGALAFQVWLSVAKPWGRTARGRRAQQQEPGTRRGVPARPTAAPAPVVATVFAAALLDVPLALTLGAPLPAFSLPALLLALAARRRRRAARASSRAGREKAGSGAP